MPEGQELNCWELLLIKRNWTNEESGDWSSREIVVTFNRWRLQSAKEREVIALHRDIMSATLSQLPGHSKSQIAASARFELRRANTVKKKLGVLQVSYICIVWLLYYPEFRTRNLSSCAHESYVFLDQIILKVRPPFRINYIFLFIFHFLWCEAKNEKDILKNGNYFEILNFDIDDKRQ